MKITAINGSPKGEKSNSTEIISMLKAGVPEAEWTVVSSIREWRKEGAALDALLAADAIVVAFPLYVDALPGSLLALLERFADVLDAAGKDAGGPGLAARLPKRVYGVANCGFYEGAQNAVALEILAHFSAACGLEWGGGIGIGTGEMIGEMKDAPGDFFMRKPVTSAITVLAGAIARGEPLGRDEYTQHGIPRWLYKAMGEAGWRGWIRKNGKKAAELHARPLDARAR